MADRKYYSETVGHFIRFYLKYPSLTTFTSPVDEKFYKIVSKHCKSLSADEYRIVDICYQPKTKMPEQVKKAVIETRLNEKSVWKFLLRFENGIAKDSGLV